MRRELQQIEASQRLSLTFLPDGSLKVKKGPSTIHKKGGIALVTGRLTKELTGNASENIKYVERTLRLWVGEYRNLYNGAVQLSPSGLELSSLRYKRVIVQFVEESLADSPSDLGSSEESSDSESVNPGPVSEDSIEDLTVLGSPDLLKPDDISSRILESDRDPESEELLSHGQFFNLSDDEEEEVYLPYSEDDADDDADDADDLSYSEGDSAEATPSPILSRHPSGRPFLTVEEYRAFNSRIASNLQVASVRSYSQKPEKTASLKSDSTLKESTLKDSTLKDSALKELSLTLYPYPYPILQAVRVPTNLIKDIAKKSKVSKSPDNLDPKPQGFVPLDESKLSLLGEFRKVREMLSDDPSALELRKHGKGVTSWTVRGQVSAGMNLRAMTGIQTSRDSIQESDDLISSSGLGSRITFISSSLRSAKDIYLKGGHVTMGYRDQDFRVSYSNTRCVIEDPENPDGSKGLLSTRPWKNVEECLTARAYSRINKSPIYSQTTGVTSIKKYNSNLEMGIRAFIKSALSSSNGLSWSDFHGYQDLVDYIHKFVFTSGWNLKRGLKCSYISQTKYDQQGKVMKLHQVPRLPCIMSFFDYVKERFPSFDTSSILQKS